MATNRNRTVIAVVAAGILLFARDRAIAQTPAPTPFPRLPVTGVVDVYVYVADFLDAQVPCTFEEIDDVAAQVAAFYRTYSFQQLTVVPHLIRNLLSPDGHFHVDHPCSDLLTDTQRYDSELSTDILAATGLDVYALASARAKLVQEYSCFRGGMGERDGSRAQVGRCLDAPMLAHELGHTFGMGHASKNRLPGSKAGEYGEREVMGHGGLDTELNAPHRMQLGWVPASNVQTITGLTDVVLTDLDATLADPMSPSTAVVKIPTSAAVADSLMFRDFYYVSLEQGRILVHGVELAPGDVDQNELILGNTLYVGRIRGPSKIYRARNGRFTIAWTSGDAAQAHVTIDVFN